jgi:hypothetical protein
MKSTLALGKAVIGKASWSLGLALLFGACATLVVLLSHSAPAGASSTPAPAGASHTSSRLVAVMPSPSESPDALLAHIRRVFRSHRPPPPYVTYTLIRKQLTDQGYPDLVNSYSYHIWVRTLDKAALARKVEMDDAFGTLEFQRPAFNEDRDPGPPTADLFEPAPAHPHPIDFVPTPEAQYTAPPVIATVTARGEFDYHVVSVQTEGSELHLTVVPIRDPERNRLREIWVDKKTLELHKLVATDKLFIEGSSDVYAVLFTVYLGWLNGMPVVTRIHGVVGDGYSGDGQIVDYWFNDITFPTSLPDWYFNPRTYSSHQNDAPE